MLTTKVRGKCIYFVDEVFKTFLWCWLVVEIVIWIYFSGTKLRSLFILELDLKGLFNYKIRISLKKTKAIFTQNKCFWLLRSHLIMIMAFLI